MEVLKREFSQNEKLLLAILFLVMLAGGYYLLVDTPVREGMADVQSQIDAATIERDAVNAKLAEIAEMEAELSKMEGTKIYRSHMPSYNAAKQELDFLNETLGNALDYFIGFSKVTRDGNQIRRGFTLQYKAKDFEDAQKIMSMLESSSIRCVVNDFSVTPVMGTSIQGSQLQVSAVATFFETMAGGENDNELPADTTGVE